MTGVTPPEKWQLDPEWGKEQIVDRKGVLVCDCAIIHRNRQQNINQANAAFIVRAAQNFEPLVQALEELLACVVPNGDDTHRSTATNRAMSKAHAALNNALK